MKIRMGLMVLGVLVPYVSLDAEAAVIDGFLVTQYVEPPPGLQASSQVSGAGLIGGERDVLVDSGFGAGTSVIDIDPVSTPGVNYTQASAGGSAQIFWDGPDNSIILDPTGLGGVDLTASGEDMFSFDVASNAAAMTLVMTVYTDGANSSTAALALPIVAAPQLFTIEFANFSVLAGAGADFTNVGALSMLLVGSPGSDIQIDTVETGSLAPIPQPATGLLVGVGLIVMGGLRRRPSQTR